MARAAAEVSRYAAEKVWDDVKLNVWDSALAKGFGAAGLPRVAAVLEEPALTLPVSKLTSAWNVVDAVWGGGSQKEAEELGRRIDGVHDQVYGRKR